MHHRVLPTFLAIPAFALAGPAWAVCDVPSASYGTLQDAETGCPVNEPVELVANVSGDTVIDRDLVVHGNGFTLTGSGSDAVIEVTNGAAVEITDLEITGGDSSSGGGGITAGAETSLLLEGVEVQGNDGQYGGIASLGTVALLDSEVHHNQASSSGGGVGIGLQEGATPPSLTVTNSAIHHNDAADDGGGIYVQAGSVDVETSAIHENTAGDSGGGMYVAAGDWMYVRNSTISDNVADNAGGLSSNGSGTRRLHLVSFVNNDATNGTGPDQLFHATAALSVRGVAFGELAGDDGVDDCDASGAGSEIRYAYTTDGTCRSVHTSNATVSSLGLSGSPGLYAPTSLSPLPKKVTGAYCLATDQVGASRAPYPCTVGALQP